MALIYNATFDKNTRKLSFEDRAGNEIYSFTVPERAPVDDLTKPLTFRATQDGSTVKLVKDGSPSGDFQTSRDGGNTWTDYTLDTAITLNTDDEVSFRAKNDRTSEQNNKNYFHFNTTGKIEAWHNVMSLYRTNDFATYNTAMRYSFFYLFKGCTSLTKAPELPATTLAGYCYYGMFSGCQSLTEAPALPATTLYSACYMCMFEDCTSLTKAPELPATTLAGYCYQSMFEGCTSLTKAPELPVTTLASSCYLYMFYGCTSLTEAPALPATKLASNCYSGMFWGCTSLTKAPELQATKLDSDCFSHMFYVCSSLNEVRCKIPSSYNSTQISYSTKDWLYDVSSTGKFYTNADANWPSGPTGIPRGWTRLNEEAPAVDDLTKPLTFRATQDSSTVKLSKTGSPIGDFQTSRDGGNTWSDYTIDTAITLNTGDEVSFRAKADRTSGQSVHNNFNFEMTGKIEAWHNVMSMYRTSDFATYNTVVEYAFNYLFSGCTSLTKAPVLPATTLADSCYESMFWDCTSLTKAPALPATTLTVSCYIDMFKGCTSLTEAPALPATTLATNCYWGMFEGCTSLTEAPALPATTLTPSCYNSMFKGCTSLVNAPVLPATTLAGSCYESMFFGCTSLKKSPALPVTKLASDCYQLMFYGCTSLTEAPALPATTLNINCYLSMFNGCTSLVKAPELPATTLDYYCYNSMFKGCTSLTEAPALPATTLADDCYKSMFEGCTSLVKAPALLYPFRRPGCYIGMFSGCSRLNEVRCQMNSEIRAEDVPRFTGDDSNPPAWLSGVSSTGKFYTNADANWPSGASGIPTGWTRLNA